MNITIDGKFWRQIFGMALAWFGIWVAFGTPGIWVLVGLSIAAFGALVVAPKPDEIAPRNRTD